MENLVIGLSKTAVAGTLAKVQSAIKHAKLQQKAIKHALVHISVEFETMQSLLNFVSEREADIMNNPTTWVRNVRDLAYDVEDLVDLFVHLDCKPVFWRRMLPSCICVALPPLDQVVAKLGDLRDRAAELSHITVSPGHKLVMIQQPASGTAVGSSEHNKLVDASDDAATRRKGFVNLAELVSDKEHNDSLLQQTCVDADKMSSPIISGGF